MYVMKEECQAAAAESGGLTQRDAASACMHEVARVEVP